VVPFYDDASVAGVGGRYLSYYRGEPIPMSPARRVGQINWLGRAFGGVTAEPLTPGVRDVDFIIGGAATYRRDLFCSFQFPREMERDVAYAYEQFIGSQARRRVFYWRLRGAHIENRVYLGPGFRILGIANHLTVSSGTSIGNVTFHAHAPVRVGKNSVINDGSEIIAGSHDTESIDFKLLASEVEIGDHAWIATRAIVMP